MPHHIYDELEGKRREEREEKCAIRDGCNTDYNKFGERMTEWENKNESSISVLMVQP